MNLYIVICGAFHVCAVFFASIRGGAVCIIKHPALWIGGLSARGVCEEKRA